MLSVRRASSHGQATVLQLVQPIMFSADEGTLPTSLTAGTAYYVVADGLTDDAFSVALTPGGAAIETAEASTGTVVGTAPPAGMTDLFQGLALGRCSFWWCS